jgi:GR25 family glycosyltransferase involved in LPS biosynthesis
MKHYWINIDRNTKRQQFMSDQFAKLGLENYRVSAHTPADFDDILVQKRPLTCKYPGCVTCEFEFACLCSHLKAMQEGLKTGDEYFVILEDDVMLPFQIDYTGLIADMPKDTEILQMLILFGNSVMQLYNYHSHTKQRYIKWQYLLPSTGMYLISRQGAQKLVDMFYDAKTGRYDFSQSPHQIVADVLLYMTAKTYATTHPYAVPEIAMGSDIHSDHLIAHEKAINDIRKIMRQHFMIPFPFVTKVNIPREQL